MKSLVIAVALVALVSSSALPLVPEDNSHYVEGESRYVWVADGDDNPLLVDLYEPVIEEELARSGADNQYWLFTRRNANSPQIIINGNAMSIWGSNYLGSRPIKVIVHGLAANGNSQINSMLTSAWLTVGDVNVIVVDWRRLAGSNYATATNGAVDVGRAIGNFVSWLISTAGGNWNDVHFTGVGIGAQIAAIAGRLANRRPRRITALNPISPMWQNNANAIRRTDGGYVEVIHTDNTITNTPLSGHVDFFPNGGRNQPGCGNTACSQSRSYHLFASTIRTNHLIGRQCFSLADAQNIRCSGSIMLHMGNGIISKNSFGIFGLTTGGSWPF
ncbi:pancreatic lipase-related protein 2-like [Epargyreus clarus]|uniref:pancreatic lipase-related protein 2-like n=1 Tax=Epargyreus clarus TaxID=520877 RepID=UPI003C2E8C17